MKHIGLFEGIGGFSLAARWMGWETIAWCEWNEFGQKVLRHHFPEAEGFGDIKKTDFTKYANRTDILTGGFPCQPYSIAGKRKGKEDDRHLWPEMLRAIREIKPSWVVGENVSGLTTWSNGMVLNEIKTGLEDEGFEVFPPVIIPACAVNAPHRRDRIWIIAYSDSNRKMVQGRYGNSSNKKRNSKEKIQERENKQFGANGSNNEGVFTNTDGARREKLHDATKSNKQKKFNRKDNALHSNGTIKQREYIGQKGEGQFDRPNCGDGINYFQNFPTQSPICSRDDGFPGELDGITFPKWRDESIKAYGNAIVPQVALQIFKAIALMEVEMLNCQPGDEVQCGVGKNNI